MSLRLVRIDDRLIHGQVVAGWLRALGGKRIVIVDDATARDEFLREVLTLAAPQGVPVEVLDVARGAARCLELAATPEPVIVLARARPASRSTSWISAAWAPDPGASASTRPSR